jgi:hypothetical protein
VFPLQVRTPDQYAEPCGEEIAGHLSRHFERFGPPLFIKRDNAGNLNHTSVNEVLEEHMVIPINSPYYTPSYNGAIEHSQGEFENLAASNGSMPPNQKGNWRFRWTMLPCLESPHGAACPARMPARPIFHHCDCVIRNVNERRRMTGSLIWPLTSPACRKE